MDSSGAEIDEAELALAVQLVDQIASDTFSPEGLQRQVRRIGSCCNRAEGCRSRSLTFAAKDAAEGAGHRFDGCPQGQSRRRSRSGSQKYGVPGLPVETHAGQEGRVAKDLIGGDSPSASQQAGFIANTGEEAHSSPRNESADDERCR